MLSRFIRLKREIRNTYHSRNFFSIGRSGITVADKQRGKVKLLTGTPESIICKVSQAELWKEAISLHKTLISKVKKSPKKIQHTFTFGAILSMFTELWYTLKVSIKKNKLLEDFGLLTNPCYLLYAYSLLKRRFGGTNFMSIGNVSLVAIYKISKQIKYSNFKPKVLQRIYISKPNGKQKYFSIPSAVDKVIQKSLILLLHPLFESMFLESSHGFKINKNCHTALRDIYKYWSGTKWFIQADFANFFDKVNHPILLGLLSKRIKSHRTLRLIDKFLKVGYIHFDKLIDTTLNNDLGTPQGSLLSPLFCNIMLHELDLFSISLCKQYAYPVQYNYLNMDKSIAHTEVDKTP